MWHEPPNHGMWGGDLRAHISVFLQTLMFTPTPDFCKALHCNMGTPLSEHMNDMVECITYGWILCGWYDWDPIPWLQLHHNHIP